MIVVMVKIMVIMVKIMVIMIMVVVTIIVIMVKIIVVKIMVITIVIMVMVMVMAKIMIIMIIIAVRLYFITVLPLQELCGRNVYLPYFYLTLPYLQEAKKRLQEWQITYEGNHPFYNYDILQLSSNF